MNSEQQELVDLAYKNYIYNPDYKAEGVADLMSSQAGQLVKCPTQEDFITECKTDPEFSERWGLKIEERELSWEERRDLLTPEQYDGTALNKYGHKDCDFGDISPFTDKVIHYWMNLHNIPTKIITITYNDKTIESYE
jgi:hypothetical protein